MPRYIALVYMQSRDRGDNKL